MTGHPAAERLAQLVVLEPESSLDGALVAWRCDYRATFKHEPSLDEEAAARRTLEHRLGDQLPPLPPSASSVSWRALPEIEQFSAYEEE